MWRRSGESCACLVDFSSIFRRCFVTGLSFEGYFHNRRDAWIAAVHKKEMKVISNLQRRLRMRMKIFRLTVISAVLGLMIGGIPSSPAGRILMGAGPSRALAQEAHAHTIPSQERDQTSEQKNEASALIKVVRESTDRFQNVSAAQAAGYYLQFGCVSGPDSGAMGMHFVNMALVTDGILDATRPAPPQLMGQLFHLFESPNRFGLPAFYSLHVWAWKDNPTGAFVNWHSNVSCNAFSGQIP